MISTKGRYALRTMLALAESRPGVFVPLKEIAEKEDISKKYLEIIMRELVAAGLVEGASGKGGGYRLLRAPEEYTVWDIIGPMEGSLAAVACLAEGAPPCPRSGVCETLPLWAEYDRLTRSFFQSRRLSDLISGKAQ